MFCSMPARDRAADSRKLPDTLPRFARGVLVRGIRQGNPGLEYPSAMSKVIAATVLAVFVSAGPSAAAPLTQSERQRLVAHLEMFRSARSRRTRGFRRKRLHLRLPRCPMPHIGEMRRAGRTAIEGDESSSG